MIILQTVVLKLDENKKVINFEIPFNVKNGFLHTHTRNFSIAGLYNATKTLAFASYFCKMQVKILYWQNIFVPSLIVFFNLNSDIDYPVF